MEGNKSLEPHGMKYKLSTKDVNNLDDLSRAYCKATWKQTWGDSPSQSHSLSLWVNM